MIVTKTSKTKTKIYHHHHTLSFRFVFKGFSNSLNSYEVASLEFFRFLFSKHICTGKFSRTLEIHKKPSKQLQNS